MTMSASEKKRESWLHGASPNSKNHLDIVPFFKNGFWEPRIYWILRVHSLQASFFWFTRFFILYNKLLSLKTLGEAWSSAALGGKMPFSTGSVVVMVNLLPHMTVWQVVLKNLNANEFKTNRGRFFSSNPLKKPTVFRAFHPKYFDLPNKAFLKNHWWPAPSCGCSWWLGDLGYILVVNPVILGSADPSSHISAEPGLGRNLLGSAPPGMYKTL